MSDTALGTNPLFAVTTKKLVIMTLSTGGLYYLYWFFRNWSAVKSHENSKIMPVARAFFLIFTCALLFRTLYGYAKSKGYQQTISTDSYAAILILAEIMGNASAHLDNQLGAILWLASFGSLYPMLEIQKLIVFHNQAIDPTWQPLATYSTFEKFVVVIGGLITLLAIAYFIPVALGLA